MTWVQIHFLGRIRIKVKRILHKKILTSFP